jgi:hypothetical protein
VAQIARSSWDLTKWVLPMVVGLMLCYALVPDVSPAMLRHAREQQEALLRARRAAEEAAATGGETDAAAAAGKAVASKSTTLQ